MDGMETNPIGPDEKSVPASFIVWILGIAGCVLLWLWLCAPIALKILKGADSAW